MKALHRLFLACALVLFAGAGEAFARDTAIIGATVFDGAGGAPRVANVIVRDGRIVAIGPNARGRRGAEIIDARGLALLPGFFDLHTHWTPGGEPAETPEIARAYLEAGVTTVSDFHQPPEAFAPRRAWYRTFATPHVNLTARTGVAGGHGASWGDTNTTRWINSPAAAPAGVRALIGYQPDLIKVFADGWRYGLGPDNASMDEATLRAIVDEAHANDLRVVTHTVTATGAREAARAGVDVIVHSVQDRELDAETIALMRASGIFYAPTLAVYDPNKPDAPAPAEPETAQRRQQLRKFAFALRNVLVLHQAGVPIALGTDAGMPDTPHGVSTLREMELLVQAGLTPSQALIAATAVSARALGLERDRGTIAAGMRADLVLIAGAPWARIEDVRNIHSVFVDGRRVAGAGAQWAPAQGAPRPPATRARVLIDDIERADGRTQLDTLRVTDFDSGQDRSSVIVQRRVRGVDNHALLLTGQMAHKPNPYAAVVFPLNPGSVAPADASAFSGVSLDLRGDEGAYELSLVGVGGRWRAIVEADGAWGERRVAFADFAGDGADGTEPQTASLLEIRVSARREPGATLWFEMDNLRFY